MKIQVFDFILNFLEISKTLSVMIRRIWRRPICLLSRSPTPCQNFSRRRVRPGVRPDVRADVRAARVSSAAPKKKSFDRGGPVWPPRSNVTNDRLGGGSGGAKPPQPKFGGSGGQRPPAKTENFSKIFRKILKKFTGGAYAINLLIGYKI